MRARRQDDMDVAAGGARTAADDSRYRWRLLAILLTATLFSVMNSSMVNVALPTLMHDFGIDIATSVWLYTGYTLPYAVAMPLFGVLGERIGAKSAFLGGVAAFMVASLLCSAAWNFPSLLVFRILQALAAASVIPNAMVLITDAFPPQQRGQALGIWSAVSGVAVGIGPVLGGVLTEYVNWHAIFWVNAPFLCGLLVVGRKGIREGTAKNAEKRFDFPGALLLIVGLSSLMLALTLGRTSGWASPVTLISFALAILGIVAFPVWEFQTPAAILPIALFRTRAYSGAVVTIFLQSMVLFGVLLLLPIYLQSVRGHSPTEAGLMILPLSLALIVFAPLGGRLSDKLGPRLPAVSGMAIVTGAVFAFAHVSATSPYSQLAIILGLVGCGLGLSVSPLTSTAMNAARPEERGAASGFFNTLRFVGAVLGSTILSVILSARTDAALPSIHVGARMAHVLALVQGFHDVDLVAAGLGVLSVVVALWLRPAAGAIEPRGST